jgi:ABC-type Na+ efflux pump permease subunit
MLFDPAIMKLYKDIMDFSLNLIVETAALNIYLEAFSQAIQAGITEQFEAYRDDLAGADFQDRIPDFPGRKEVIAAFHSGLEETGGDSAVIRLQARFSGMDDLVDVEVGIAGGREHVIEYNIVRNNVPAFILFAMFFIVIPLAGSILHEKQDGTRNRLLTLPVNWFILYAGKITVYLGVCISQFMLMIIIGRYLIPLICELPPLSLDVDLLALAAIAIASGLAAIGFGLIIGTLSSTYQQAGPIGSVLVVVLAVMGGVFVPSYMMPDAISKISFISPLRWGADAFYSVFARNAGLGMVLKEFILLMVFFIITLVLSFRAISKHA